MTMAGPADYTGDLLLVDRCLEGEQRAARELFRQHQARVQATLYRVLGSNSDMEDLLQESFVQVFRSLHSFRGESRLSTWIDRIAARVAYKYIGRQKKARAVRDTSAAAPPELYAVDDVEGVTSQADARRGVRAFYEALGELGAASRVAFALHHIDGRPIKEVAELVGSSVTATKLRIWRARKSLLKIAAGDPRLEMFLCDVDFSSEENA